MFPGPFTQTGTCKALQEPSLVWAVPGTEKFCSSCYGGICHRTNLLQHCRLAKSPQRSGNFCLLKYLFSMWVPPGIG